MTKNSAKYMIIAIMFVVPLYSAQILETSFSWDKDISLETISLIKDKYYKGENVHNFEGSQGHLKYRVFVRFNEFPKARLIEIRWLVSFGRDRHTKEVTPRFNGNYHND